MSINNMEKLENYQKKLSTLNVVVRLKKLNSPFIFSPTPVYIDYSLKCVALSFFRQALVADIVSLT